MGYKFLTGLGVGFAAAVIIWKGMNNCRPILLARETVAIPKLPPGFEGFRLLLLADLHLRRFSPHHNILLKVIEELDPDMICLAGDYAYNDVSLGAVDKFFTALAHRKVVVGIYGNADHRCFSERARQGWSRYFPFLDNSSFCLKRQGESLWIAGVDDPHLDFDNLSDALEGIPADAPVILLAHSPEIILRPLDPRIHLILSGHTHGGQICLPNGKALITNLRIPAKFAAGRHELNGVTLYISRGVGATRLPLRYGCPPEITLVTLTNGE